MKNADKRHFSSGRPTYNMGLNIHRIDTLPNKIKVTESEKEIKLDTMVTKTKRGCQW